MSLLRPSPFMRNPQRDNELSLQEQSFKEKIFTVKVERVFILIKKYLKATNFVQSLRLLGNEDPQTYVFRTLQE
jgi:hypothetical protein